MEPQGLSFGQPVSIVCPVIRTPQSAASEQQRGSVPDPAVGPADEPRRRHGDGAADSTTDRSDVLRTVTADEPSAGDADDSCESVMYVAKDEDTSEPRTPSLADDDDEEEEDDGPPAAEEASARVDPLMMLCQAAQQTCHTEDSEQRVPATPEVHFGELSYTDTPPQNTDDEEAAYGHDELPMEETHELPIEETHELPMEENHELPTEENHELPVEDERHQELPVQDHHHNSPVQEQQKVPVQEHFEVPVASAPSAVMVPLRMKGVEVECEVRPLDLKGSTLLSAAAQGGLTVAVAPGNQQEGSSKVATQKLYFLYPEPQEVYAAPVPPVDSSAVAQEVYVAPVTQDGCTTVAQEVYVAPVTQNGSTTVAQPADARMVTFFDRAGEPQASGRDSPAVLHFSTQHGKRQLHLSLNCDGETCCRSQDTPSYASDPTVQISQTVRASLSATVQEPATIEYRPQNADGESQKLEKEPDVTIATPDSTGDEQTAVGQDSPIPEGTTECTSDAQPNSNAAESESSGPASATQDAAATTDTSPNQTADKNLNNSEAKRDDTVDDSSPDLSCTNSEAKNPSLHGRRTKNPVRRHIVSATPSNDRKPVSRRHGAATSDSVVSKGRRKSCVADPAPVKEPEKQQMRDNRHSALEVIRTEEDASESVNAESGTRSTIRKDFGHRRGGSRGRRRPVAAASSSPRANSTATEAGTVAGAGECDHERDAKRKKRLRDTTTRKDVKASSRSRDEWMLQPLCSPPGQDAPLRLVVKRRTLTVSESSDLPSEYAVKEAVKSPLGIQVEDIEKSKTGLRRRRHSTNDCQSNDQESQMNKSRHFSQNMDKPNFSVQWRKRRKPARHLNVNSEDDLSNDADDDNDDDEDWVPNSYKQRKSVTGGHNNFSKRMNLAKRRKSVASITDELLQIPCTETVATMTASPERLAEKNKEESLIKSTDTLPVTERNNTTVAETIVTALTDTSKSSVEEHVSDTTHDSVVSHSTTKYNQPVVSRTKQKVACNTDESYQEPAPKKYKKAWQELWSAQQNDEQAKASLTEMPHRTEELPHEDEECTRDHTQQSTAETSPASSSHVVPPSSSSHMNQQETSEVQCKDKALEMGAISSGLDEDPHSMSDNSVETLSDTTTDESDNETGPVTLHKCRSVVPHQGVPVHTLHHPGGLTSQQPQGRVSEGLYVVNGRTLRVRVQEVEDGPLDPALSQVPREIIERCVQQMKRSNELVPSVHSLNNGFLHFKNFSPYNLDIKPFICHNIGHKMERPFYPPCTRIKQETADDIQPPIFAPSSGKFPYAGQPLGCSNMVIQTEGCRRKDCYRRKGVSVQKKDGSQNDDVIVISDSDDDCSKNNCGASTKFQGGEEKKDGDSNDNDDIKILSDFSLTGPCPKKDILYDTELRQRIYRTLRREILRKKKGFFLKKWREEFEKRRRSFKAAQQGNSSLSELTDEAYLWGLVSQLTSTESVGKNVNSYSQKHIEKMAEHECDTQGPGSLCHSSSISLKSDMCPLNDTERSVLSKKGQKKSAAHLLESAEKSSNSNSNDALKMEDNLHQFCEVTEEKADDIPLNNCQHKNQQSYTSIRQVSGAEEIAESKKHTSSSAVPAAVPEPDSLHVSGKEVTDRVSVPCSNSLIVGSMTENLPMDVNKLVTEDDSKHPKLCDGQKLADLKLKSCQASNNVNKNQADCTHIADLNNVHQETCKSSGDVVVKEAINTHAVDTNDVAQKLCETSGNIVTKLADDTPVIDLDNVAHEILETSSDIVTKQTDKTLGDNLNDVAVKESLITDQSPSEENSGSSAGVGLPMGENVHESVNLKNVSNVRPEADLCITIDITSDDSQSEPSPGLPSSNLTDISLKKEMVNVKNSPNLPQVGGSSVTVDGGCEVSAAISSENLIEQLVQSQQNSRVFDPLVSLIKARPIVGDFALRYEMMVNKELTRLHKQEAKEKEMRNKYNIGFLGDSKTKKKKKKKKRKKLFSGKGFCGFEDNDKDMDGWGPAKGGFSGGTLTFTAIVTSFFPLEDNFLNKAINFMKWSKGLSHTLRITCWLLYFGFQHLYPFTI